MTNASDRTRLSNKLRLEEIDALDEKTLLALLSELKEDLTAIDASLVARKEDFLSGPRKSHDELESYYEWRKRAIAAKSIKTRMLMATKTELTHLKAMRPRPVGEGTFWRTQGHAFLEVLHSLENLDLPPRAANLITTALAEYEEAVKARVAEKWDNE